MTQRTPALLVQLAISSEPGSARQSSSLARRRERVISSYMASERNNASGEEGRLNVGQNLWRAALGNIAIATFICASCMGAEEQTQNSAKQVDEPVARISFLSPSRPCADVIVTLPNQHAPSFRALLPEFVTDLPHSRYFHTNPVDWKEQEGGSWLGTIAFKNFGRIVISLLPREYYVEITWTLENLSTKPLKKTVLDFCFGANNGGGSWANQEFLPSSRMNRKEDGEYWHDRVARKGTYVHSAGAWSQDPNAKLDASVLVIVNEAKDRYAFQMWNKPVVGTWINRANACMHLKPVLCESLGVGEKAEIRGRMGISREGLEQVWHLSQSFIQINK